MEYDKKYIGQKAILTEKHDSLLKNSTIIIRGLHDNLYQCEVINGKWENNNRESHDCLGLFSGKSIGYNIYARRLKIIEDEVKIIETDINDPFPGIEVFE